nr:lysozyme [Bacteroides sp.]
MTKLFTIIVSAMLSLMVVVADPDSGLTVDSRAHYETAISLIKKYETLHKAKDWPYIGYGHRVWPGDKYKRGVKLTETEADILLRKDFDKLCAMYRTYGADSILLATLAYNLGHGAVNRSSVLKKLKAGNRDIRESYISYCKFNGRPHKGIRTRRIEEFDSLFQSVQQ